MPRDYPTVLELVGGTPIVRLQKLGKPGGPMLQRFLPSSNS